MAAINRPKIQNGYGEKLQVKVVTVQKEKRRVECVTRDGAMIWAAVWETGTVFRWPEVGETWTVRRDMNVWRLDQIVHTEVSEAESEAVPKSLEELPEGDTRVIGETVHMNDVAVESVSGKTVSAKTLSAETAESKKLKVETLEGNGAWHEIPLENGWTNYEPGANPTFSHASYRKAVDGKVTLRGLIAHSGGPPTAFSVPILTLPEGFRPKCEEIYLTHENVIGFSRVDVMKTGWLIYGGSNGSNPVGYMSISGISFYTDS